MGRVPFRTRMESRKSRMRIGAQMWSRRGDRELGGSNWSGGVDGGA